MTKYDGSSHTPIIFPDPSSLGYAIQGISLLGEFIKRSTPGNLYVEADPRLIPLFERSYKHPCVNFIPTDKAEQFPLPNNGKPQTAKEMETYFSANAKRLAKKFNLSRYAWSTLLRPEIAPPFNAHTLSAITPSQDKAIGYLSINNQLYYSWKNALDEDNSRAVLVNWNKGFSQHGDAAKQNMDAQDVALIIHTLGYSTDEKLKFYNAVHGIGDDDLNAVNSHLPKHLHMHMIIDPKTQNVFNLGQELDSYASLMLAVQDRKGIMLGVGNTYQHLWSSVVDDRDDRLSQIVVLPDGDFPTKPIWEWQANIHPQFTATVNKALHPDTGRMSYTAVGQIVTYARKGLQLG